MARFTSCASRLGKRSRNVSETGSLSSWGSEMNVLSDVEEGTSDVRKRRRGHDQGAASPDLENSGKAYTSSDDEFQQPSSSGSSRGKKPKCFSRNAVLARQNRLKKKKYMEDLETELQTLRRENSKLKVSLGGYSKDIELVRKENLYLRNVLANSKEISQLLRSININCGLPSTTPGSQNCGVKRQSSMDSHATPKVSVESVVPAPSAVNTCSDSCAPSADVKSSSHVARTVKRSFPISADDVSLSLSAPEDEDDLDILFGKNVPADLDFNLNEASTDDADYLGFGPNALGDWLDGDEPLADIGVCLHVAKKKVSLEFCASCNDNAFSSWSGITV